MIKYIFLICSGVAAEYLFACNGNYEAGATTGGQRMIFHRGCVKNAATAATAATHRKLHVVFCSGLPLQAATTAATNCPP